MATIMQLKARIRNIKNQQEYAISIAREWYKEEDKYEREIAKLQRKADKASAKAYEQDRIWDDLQEKLDKLTDELERVTCRSNLGM